MTTYIVQYQRVDNWKEKNKISWIDCGCGPTHSIAFARKIKKYQKQALNRKARIVKIVMKRSIVK
jgi:hypothetical protein